MARERLKCLSESLRTPHSSGSGTGLAPFGGTASSGTASRALTPGTHHTVHIRRPRRVSPFLATGNRESEIAGLVRAVTGMRTHHYIRNAFHNSQRATNLYPINNRFIFMHEKRIVCCRMRHVREVLLRLANTAKAAGTISLDETPSIPESTITAPRSEELGVMTVE